MQSLGCLFLVVTRVLAFILGVGASRVFGKCYAMSGYACEKYHLKHLTIRQGKDFCFTR